MIQHMVQEKDSKQVLSLIKENKMHTHKNLTIYLFLVEEAYTQQGRAHIRRLHPDWAARPALMSRAAHVGSKAVVRIEVAVSPRPCLGCAVELVLRVAPLRRGVPPR